MPMTPLPIAPIAHRLETVKKLEGSLFGWAPGEFTSDVRCSKGFRPRSFRDATAVDDPQRLIELNALALHVDDASFVANHL